MAFPLDEAAFKARWPAFDDVDTAIVDQAILDSTLYVDTSWPAVADELAQGLYIAHALSVQGFGSTATGQAAAVAAIADVAGLTKFKIKELEIGISDKLLETTSTQDPLASTSYGRQFIELRDKYFGGGMWTR